MRKECHNTCTECDLHSESVKILTTNMANNLIPMLPLVKNIMRVRKKLYIICKL